MSSNRVNALQIKRAAVLPVARTSAMVVLLAGCCAAYAELATPTDAQSPTQDARASMACSVPTNCVNSFDSSGLVPLRIEGTAAQALAALRTTLAEFPEAKILNSDERNLHVVFTTAIGFKDLVDFRIDAQAKRIDYRSRSSFGLYDFGKNRSRMEAFSAGFNKTTQR